MLGVQRVLYNQRTFGVAVVTMKKGKSIPFYNILYEKVKTLINE